MPQMPRLSPLQKALALFDDSPTKFAAALGETVLRQHVEHWVKADRVPADKCPLIERATREKGQPVTCEELRPDVAWGVLREQAKAA